MCGRILGLSAQAGGNRIDVNTIDLPENDFGLLAAIGPVLRQGSVHHASSAYRQRRGRHRPRPEKRPYSTSSCQGTVRSMKRHARKVAHPTLGQLLAGSAIDTLESNFQKRQTGGEGVIAIK
jgi:hypothetical protein